MDYKIITDGSCDLPPAFCQEKDVDVVPFYVSFDSETYKKEITEMPIRDFYEQMVSDPATFPKSSMPSVQDYVDVFLPVVKEGKAVLCICITTKFSGSYQSAMNAKEIVLESFPDARITVMDSTINTVLQGIFVIEAVRMYEAALSYDKVIERLEEIKRTGRIFFTVGNIDYLKHGGRIGKLAGIAGSMLGRGKSFPQVWHAAARSPLRRCMNCCGSIFRRFMQYQENTVSVLVMVMILRRRRSFAGELSAISTQKAMKSQMQSCPSIRSARRSAFTQDRIRWDLA